MAAPAGILVPAPDAAGLFQAFQVRADAPQPDAPRYTWLSSRGLPDGTSSGAPAAVWRPELAVNGTVWITEGSLKACIAAHSLPACVVGVAGVATWQNVPAVLNTLAARPAVLVVAYDAGLATKPQVLQHREALARTLSAAGYRTDVATWDGRRAKGIDDAVLADVAIDVHLWQPLPVPLQRPPVVQHLPPLVHPAAWQTLPAGVGRPCSSARQTNLGHCLRAPPAEWGIVGDPDDVLRTALVRVPVFSAKLRAALERARIGGI